MVGYRHYRVAEFGAEPTVLPIQGLGARRMRLAPNIGGSVEARSRLRFLGPLGGSMLLVSPVFDFLGALSRRRAQHLGPSYATQQGFSTFHNRTAAVRCL